MCIINTHTQTHTHKVDKYSIKMKEKCSYSGHLPFVVTDLEEEGTSLTEFPLTEWPLGLSVGVFS